MRSDSEPFVRMVGITKRFGGVWALRGVDFTVDRGEVVGLVGDNGAGKSTLIKILAGVYPPDQGELYIDGERVRFKSPLDAKARGIETVYQELALVDQLDVPANVFLGREPTSGPFIDRSRMRQEAQVLLASLEIQIDSLRTPVSQLSGGQRQAVAIARAVRTEPRLVIFDEPTAALAPPEAARVLELVRRLRARGIAAVFISHTLQHVFAVADRIVVLRSGMKVADRPAAATTLEEVVRQMVGEG
jgi:simple sugar transport system ATP-binding protein